MMEEVTAPLGTQKSSGTQVGSAPSPPPLGAATTGGVEAPTVPVTNEEPSMPAPTQAPTQTDVSTQEVCGKRKPSRPPSSCWTHFKREGDKAVCNYYGKTYACNSSNHGTTNLNKHLKVCPKNPSRETDKKQKTLHLGKECETDSDNSISFKLIEFSQELTRNKLAKMIVVDELPFKFVENLGFKEFMATAQPRFKIPSRVTVAKDCMELYVEEKVKLKSLLSCNFQMVSLTTDTWTSIQNMNYMCVTGHYIDQGWELNKKILGFGLIADHKGETIGKALEQCIKDWGISKVCCVTVDNASANSTALAYLKTSLNDWNGTTLLDAEYMHLRCCAHILNLVVSDGMKEMDSSIAKIRASCKYVKASPARLASFRKCAEEANISTKLMPVLDVPTRWNSTYLMLETAEKYEKAFRRMELDDPFYPPAVANEGGPPDSDDWKRARIFREFLKIFYDATLAFSGSLHVTSNSFFPQLNIIQETILGWMEGDDGVLKRMATSMKTKFDKYWDFSSGRSVNYLLLVAVFLDPRYKFGYFEDAFPALYPENSSEMIKKLEDIIKKLFAQYVEWYPHPTDTRDVAVSSDVSSQSHLTQGSQGSESGVRRGRILTKYREKMKKKQGEHKRNELERYMEDEVEDDYDGFDILRWWRSKSQKYYVLSNMARDILAIPVSTVSSESAFSTGGRVLDPYRSSLHPNTVEALICTQNWLKPLKKVVDSQQPQLIDRIESEMSGITAFAAIEEVGVDVAFTTLQGDLAG